MGCFSLGAIYCCILQDLCCKVAMCRALLNLADKNTIRLGLYSVHTRFNNIHSSSSRGRWWKRGNWASKCRIRIRQKENKEAACVAVVVVVAAIAQQHLITAQCVYNLLGSSSVCEYVTNLLGTARDYYEPVIRKKWTVLLSFLLCMYIVQYYPFLPIEF